eukprot:jgi/Picsp_1/843/NSC_04331-R1_hypothetical protein CHLNCDRAFT_49731 [Chlorella variabilis]
MADGDQDGFKRIGQVLGYMVAPHAPGDPVPPPPEEMVDIAYNTMLSAAIGALFEGSRRRLDDKSGKAMSSPHAKQHVRAIAEANKQRLANVARAGLKGAGRFGSFSALFLGTKFFLGVYRDSRDYYNSTCGGLVAGGAMGMSILLGASSSVPATNASARTGLATATLIRAVIMGSALGGLLGFSAGVLEDVIVENLPEEEAKLRRLKIEQTMAIARGEGRSLIRFGSSTSDPVGDVIRQLESQQISTNNLSSGGGKETENPTEEQEKNPLESLKEVNSAQAPSWWRRVFWWRTQEEKHCNK